MSKKLLTLCMALAAIAALAVPAVASASPVLTENGVAVNPEPSPGVHPAIKGVQVGVSKFQKTNLSETYLECSTGEMSGELTKNNGTEIEGKITSAAFGGTGAQATGEPKPECTSKSTLNFGNSSITPQVSTKAPWCISSKGEDKLSVSGGACPGGNTIKFIMASTIAGNCEYESTGSVVGTYNTGGTVATATVTPTSHEEKAGEAVTNGFKLISGGFACPTSGSLEMKFELETAAGGKLTIS